MIKILNIYKEYQDKVISPLVSKNPNIQYSNIFFIAKLDKSADENKTIMVIGQNAMDNTEFDKNNLVNQQSSSNKYLEKQIYGVDNGYKKNSSAFWRLIRSLNKSKCEVIWNNIDKVNRVKNGKAIDLSFEEEAFCNASYGVNKKTILQKEIDYYSPDVLLFVTGPNYWKSMSAAFQIDDEILEKLKPTLNNSLVDISSVIDMNVQSYWTYHPYFLATKFLLDDNIEIILKSIN